MCESVKITKTLQNPCFQQNVVPQLMREPYLHCLRCTSKPHTGICFLYKCNQRMPRESPASAKVLENVNYNHFPNIPLRHGILLPMEHVSTLSTHHYWLKPEKQLYPQQEVWSGTATCSCVNCNTLARWGMKLAACTSRIRKEALSSESWLQFRYKLCFASFSTSVTGNTSLNGVSIVVVSMRRRQIDPSCLSWACLTTYASSTLRSRGSQRHPSGN